jgi:hypothetical protein
VFRNELSYLKRSSFCRLSSSWSAKERNVYDELEFESDTLLRDPIMGELSFLAFRLSDNILIGVGFSLVGSRLSENNKS